MNYVDVLISDLGSANRPLALVRKSTRKRTKHHKIPRDRRELREGETGAQRRGGTHDGRPPQGLTGTWEQADGDKGGAGAQSQETTADAGTRRGAQRRVAEANG